jgi:hypothetical protein
MSKPFPHSREPFDTPPERPLSMTFDTGFAFREDDASLTLEVLCTGTVLLVGDPLDHPLATYGRDDAEMFRANARQFAWLADVLEKAEPADGQSETPAAPGADKKPAQPELSPEFQAWANK